MGPANKWLVCLRPLTRPRLRLVCFPYAGGSANVYRPWRESLPADVELWAAQLPGREGRLLEAPATDLHAVVAALAAALPPGPLAFFGHSLGAIVAYELTLALARAKGLQPERLFVSGSRAPQLRAERPSRRHDLPDEAFREELRKLNGTPRELLENSELMELMLPALRADFALCDRYEFRGDVLLQCPLVALAGSADDEARPDQVVSWAAVGEGPFALHVLPGDHFFVKSAAAALLEILGRELAPPAPVRNETASGAEVSA